MGARVICMASAKGGSGKTTLTATLAAFLRGLGKQVAMIDTDASTNGLTLLYLKEVRIHHEFLIAKKVRPEGVFELGTGPSGQPNPCWFQLPSGVYLMPATYSFQNTEGIDPAQYRNNLSRALLDLREKVDFIFLDAQAGSDVFASISISRHISDEVVIVSEFDPISAAGVERLKALFREDLTYGRTWVLLNKILPDFAKSFGEFMEIARYLHPITWDAEVVKSFARRRLALDFDNINLYTASIARTLQGLLIESMDIEIKEWMTEAQEGAMLPIRERIGRLEKDIYYLEEKISLRERSKLKSLFIVAGIIVAILFLVGTLLSRQVISVSGWGVICILVFCFSVVCILCSAQCCLRKQVIPSRWACPISIGKDSFY